MKVINNIEGNKTVEIINNDNGGGDNMEVINNIEGNGSVKIINNYGGDINDSLHNVMEDVTPKEGKKLCLRYYKSNGYVANPQYYNVDDELCATTIGAVDFDDFAHKVHTFLNGHWVTNLYNNRESALIPNNYPYTGVLFTESFIAKLKQDYPGIDLAEVEGKLISSDNRCKEDIIQSYIKMCGDFINKIHHCRLKYKYL